MENVEAREENAGGGLKQPHAWLLIAALLGGNIALATGPLFVRMADTGPVSAALAQVSPFATTKKLGPDGAATIAAAIHEAIDEGLAYERTRDDMSSSKDRPGAVHGRAGEACPVCGDTVRAVEYSGYTVNYCPTCQTGGKVLADNTTSKFLK